MIDELEVEAEVDHACGVASVNDAIQESLHAFPGPLLDLFTTQWLPDFLIDPVQHVHVPLSCAPADPASNVGAMVASLVETAQYMRPFVFTRAGQ